MKAIVLCAGFGTRLERDLLNDESGQYKHLIGVPKPLLPIGGMPLITHWARIIHDVPDIDTAYIVVCNVDKSFTQTHIKHVKNTYILDIILKVLCIYMCVL